MNQAVNEGNTASFICQATSKPVSVINWYYNGAPVSNDSDMSKYNISQSPLTATTIVNTLRITNVQSSEVGTYICNATNVVPTDTSSGVLTVNGELLLAITFIFSYSFDFGFLLVGPNITTPMKEQQLIVFEGRDASITCTATGYPVPTVVWQNSDGSSIINNRLVSGSPVISSTGIGNVTSVSVELMVIGAVMIDSGMYRCLVTNAINSTFRSIVISVRGMM